MSVGIVTGASRGLGLALTRALAERSWTLVVDARDGEALRGAIARLDTVDPGDMRTQMQQDAFLGEDISDRPPPEESVPGLLAFIEGSLPTGRYQARELP